MHFHQFLRLKLRESNIYLLISSTGLTLVYHRSLTTLNVWLHRLSVTQLNILLKCRSHFESYLKDLLGTIEVHAGG